MSNVTSESIVIFGSVLAAAVIVLWGLACIYFEVYDGRVEEWMCDHIPYSALFGSWLIVTIAVFTAFQESVFVYKSAEVAILTGVFMPVTLLAPFAIDRRNELRKQKRRRNLMPTDIRDMYVHIIERFYTDGFLSEKLGKLHGKAAHCALTNIRHALFPDGDWLQKNATLKSREKYWSALRRVRKDILSIAERESMLNNRNSSMTATEIDEVRGAIDADAKCLVDWIEDFSASISQGSKPNPQEMALMLGQRVGNGILR